MFDSLAFVIESIIQFINSLRTIYIHNNLTLLDYFIGLSALSIIFTFVIRFFKVEKSIMQQESHKNFRSNIDRFKWQRRWRNYERNYYGNQDKKRLN